MQLVLPWKDRIDQYQAGFKGLDFERPQRCLECGSAKFHKWGKYMRHVVEKDGEHLIPIQRIRCIRCGQTHSYLPSFCISRCCFCADFIMAMLNALIQRIHISLEERRRRAYAFLRRFRESENLWLVFLRSRGFEYLPKDKQERGMKIFSALLEIHRSGALLAGFFEETGRHFMSVK